MQDFLPRLEDSIKAYKLKEYVRHSRLDSLPDQRKRWHHDLRWFFSDGTMTALTGDHLSGEVVPANPGFEIINVEFDLAHDCPTIMRQPVIGWRVTRAMGVEVERGDGELKPIGEELRPLVQCRQPRPGGIDISGVRQPDGRVYSRGHWYPNEDAFLNATKSHWPQKKQRMLLEERHKDCPFCSDKRRRQPDDDKPF